MENITMRLRVGGFHFSRVSVEDCITGGAIVKATDDGMTSERAFTTREEANHYALELMLKRYQPTQAATTMKGI